MPHLTLDHLLHGGDYNPDQWMLDPAILDEDLSRMAEARVNSVTLGIFTWTLYEPAEGQYTFDWMHQLLDRLHAAGICVFLCTPSGSKPMWMAEKYPDIRRVNREGLRERSGHRHNHCPSSTRYREKVAALNDRLAAHFAGHPALKLWHVSNELQGECFCDHCLGRFRQWLQTKYTSLDALNQAWWARFWNHSFTDWSQIDPRDGSIDGMQLDWRRFVNTLHMEFLDNEIAPLRRHTPDIPVTTNYMGFKATLDYWRWSAHIDVISNDSYPNYFGEPGMWRKAADISLVHDLMRGMARGKPWILMESSPSAVNWKPINKLKPDGVHLMECAQSVAHGADAILYFQFRKGRGGSEKYHGAILDHDSRSSHRVFREVTAAGTWLEQHAALAGATCPRAEVALLHDWESQWAVNTSQGLRQPPTTPKDPRDAYHDLLNEHHRGWWLAGIPTDVLWPDAPDFTEQLAGRRVILAPAQYLLKPAHADALLNFVHAGGRLVLSHLSGIVDEHNRCLLGGWPGLGLHTAAGVKITEWDSLFDGETRAVEAEGPLSGSFRVDRAFGLLELQGATPFAFLREGHWSGSPVATRHPHGNGEIFVLAANFDEDFYHAFAASLVRELNLFRPVPANLPRGVHAARREKDATAHTLLINYTAEPQTVDLPGTSIPLAPFAVECLPPAPIQ